MIPINDIDVLMYMHNHNIIKIDFNTKTIKLTNSDISIAGYEKLKNIMLSNGMHGITLFADRTDRIESVNLFVDLFKAIHSHKVIK